jgi:hypothetical protein
VKKTSVRERDREKENSVSGGRETDYKKRKRRAKQCAAERISPLL